eukprot:677184-Rhodomonas_salina.1
MASSVTWCNGAGKLGNGRHVTGSSRGSRALTPRTRRPSSQSSLSRPTCTLRRSACGRYASGPDGVRFGRWIGYGFGSGYRLGGDSVSLSLVQGGARGWGVPVSGVRLKRAR